VFVAVAVVAAAEFAEMGGVGQQQNEAHDADDERADVPVSPMADRSSWWVPCCC